MANDRVLTTFIGSRRREFLPLLSLTCKMVKCKIRYLKINLIYRTAVFLSSFSKSKVFEEEGKKNRINLKLLVTH